MVGTIRPSLRNGFTAYTRSPRGTGLDCPRHRAARHCATWCQRRGTRTTRLRRPHRLHSSREPTRPSHPASNVRDDREAPLVRKRDSGKKAQLSEKRKPNIFRGGTGRAGRISGGRNRSRPAITSHIGSGHKAEIRSRGGMTYWTESVVAILLVSFSGVASAQVDCGAMPHGLARTDCYLALSQFYRAQSDLAAARARVQSDAAWYRAITGTAPPKHRLRRRQ